jgi:hypothetical protein
MTVTARRWLIVLSTALLALGTLILPAAAQSLPGSGGVSCDPANPDPGQDTTCTAEGLEPSSSFDWEAEFADGTVETGSGVADDEGVGEFVVSVPEGEEAEGDYTVTVTGTNADGEPYEESHQGTVGGGSPLDALTPPGDEPSEEPTEEPSEEPAPGDDDDGTAPAPDDGGQVGTVPSGGVAAGFGGLADDGGSGGTTALVALLVAAAAGGAVYLRRRLAARPDQQ